MGKDGRRKGHFYMNFSLLVKILQLVGIKLAYVLTNPHNLIITKLLQSKNVIKKTGNIFATFGGVVGLTFFDWSTFLLMKLVSAEILGSLCSKFAT